MLLLLPHRALLLFLSPCEMCTSPLTVFLVVCCTVVRHLYSHPDIGLDVRPNNVVSPICIRTHAIGTNRGTVSARDSVRLDVVSLVAFAEDGRRR